MKKFLCLIIESSSGKEITEMRINASDDLCAKYKAADMFYTNQKYIKRFREFGENWYVDTCEI